MLGGAVAATGAIAGAGIDHALTGGATPTGGGTLKPDHGVWHPVASAADLPEGAVRSFEAGSVTGFLTRRDGRLQAVSGVCTHQGCRLNLEAGTRLRCPCHHALFSLDGAVLHHRLPIRLQALPRLAARQSREVVEVYVSSV